MTSLRNTTHPSLHCTRFATCLARSCVALLLLCCSMAFGQGFQPTQAQIDQFMRLSPQQQKELAAKLGIDLSQYQTNSKVSQSKAEPLQQIDRGTVLHATSNAIGAQYGQTAIDKESMGTEKIIQSYVELGLIDPEVADQIVADAAAKQEEDSSLHQFGYELFSGDPNAFMPTTDVPASDSYTIGPGDEIVIQLYGKESASHSLPVNRDGTILFPDLGPLSVAGLTFAELKEFLLTTIEKQMIGVKASITLGQLRSIRVFVLGEAISPGSYPVNSLSTVTNALFASGGVTPIGSLRNIQLKRNGKVITTIDLYDLLLKGDTSGDARLMPGDVIFIPPIGDTVAVSGEVLRPAIYELKPKEENNAAHLVKIAGGLTATAYPAASRLERIDAAGERTVINFDLGDTKGKQLKVKDGDHIEIMPVLEELKKAVTLQGHVERPGNYAWHDGLRFTDIVSSALELKADPDMSAALIIRELMPTRRISVTLFSPNMAFAKPGSEDDPLLSNRDQIMIFNFNDDRSQMLLPIIERLTRQGSKQQRRQVVSVLGIVKFPGKYPLTQGMTDQDLIALAGGLDDNAYSLGAEITRYIYDESEQQSIEHISISLTQQSATQLKEEDNLLIKRTPNWVGIETVTIEGEVAFPGEYTIQRGETLSQLVQRAGGLNRYSAPTAAVFSRESLRQLEAQRLQDLRSRLEADIAASNTEVQDSRTRIGTDDAKELLSAIGSIKPAGRMVIDLPKILSGEAEDIVLKDKDTLKIPDTRQSITVVGEVQFPTSHIYEERTNYKDYIEQSGGLNAKADKSRIYVVRANGRVFLPKTGKWFKKGSNEILPGDTIVVPLDTDRIDSLTLWTNVSQIFYQVGLGAAAIASF